LRRVARFRRHRRVIGPVGPQLPCVIAVRGQFVEFVDLRERERPAERVAGLLGCHKVFVTINSDVGRDAWLRAEELFVHVLPCQTGRTLAEQADQRRVEVAVAANDAQLSHLVRRELVHLEGADALPCFAPCDLRVEHDSRAGERRYGFRKDLTDVGSGVERKPH
jgi:hypothetical protein